MEPVTTVEAAARSRSGLLTPGHLLADSWAAWSRNALPILGTVLLLQAPVALAELLPERSPPAGIWLGLLSSLVGAVASLAQTGAITFGGLLAPREEPLHVGELLTEGLRRAWLTFKVGFLSWWVVFLLIAIAVFVGRANLPVSLSTEPVASEVQFWFLTASNGIGSVAVMVWYFPAVPVALSQPELGARSAVRRARELTRGARARLLPVALAFECLSVPLWIPYRWAAKLPAGGGKTVAMIAFGVLGVAIASFFDVGRVVVCRALRREREGAAADLEGLERVFE